MSEPLSEILATAERAVTGSEADKSALARLLKGIDLTDVGGPDDRTYLAVLLDWLGMREQAMLAVSSANGDQDAGTPNLAGMLAFRHGDYERARELFGQALSAAGDDAPLRDKILANLAALSLLTGETGSASEWLAQAGGTRGEVNDPATEVLMASTGFGIARARGDLSGLRDAVSWLNEATRARVAELGFDHPLALTATANLAAAEFELATAEESPENQQRAITVLEVAAHRLAADLGADHPQALACVQNLCVADRRLAVASGSVDRERRAATALESVSRQMAAVAGKGHPRARTTAANTAPAGLDLEEPPQKRRGADIGIITVIAEEASAIRETLGLRPALTAGLSFDLGIIHSHGKPVSIAATRTLAQGQESTMAAFQRLHQQYDPAVIVLVGIAGGIHPDIRLGDVVIATRVICYDLRKETPAGTVHRGQERQAPTLIGRAVNSFFTDHGEPATLPTGKPGNATGAARVLNGTISSGNAVIADRDSEILRYLKRFNDKILAVDVESAGLSLAYDEGLITEGRPLGWLVVRGISDDASPRKGDDYHHLAALNAARALRELIPYLPTAPAH